MSFLLSLLAAVGLRSGKAPISTGDLVEASAGFDAELVKPFLLQLSEDFEAGFSSSQAAVLARRINSLWIGQSGNWEYQVRVGGDHGRLVVAGFKDDFSAPDIYLFSSASIAPLVQHRLSTFLEAAAI